MKIRRTTFLAATMVFLLAGGAFAQDPVEVSPEMYTVLLENDQVRVLEFRCTPGEKEPMHSHPNDLVIYNLTSYSWKATTSDGEITEGESEAGSTLFFDGGVVHSWECLESEQRTIIVELKGAEDESGGA